MQTGNLQLIYTLLCDDVRIEMGNKISLMGIFQNIMVDKLPISLIKFAVINHWKGEGNHQTEVRILAPDRSNLVVTSQPTAIELAPGGFTDNVGTAYINRVVAQKRAQSVVNYLVSKGIPISRLESKGYGEDTPVANNAAELNGRDVNRRIEIKILSK
jgi:hypothetical protein